MQNRCIPFVMSRSIRCAAGRTRHAGTGWVEAHHYLACKGLFGKALCHVAIHDDTWLALLGWTTGAFKVGARDLSRNHTYPNSG